MILPVRRGGLDRQQRKKPFAPLLLCVFARRKNPPRRTRNAAGQAAKKGSRQGRKKSLCAFPTLRLCVNKKIRGGGPAKKGRCKDQDPFAALLLGAFA